jgi:hypothetical protein
MMAEEEQKQPLTTGSLVKRMVEVRDERRKISARDKELVEEWRSLEMEMLTRLDEQGMEKASTADGTASISETVLPQVVDWDAFYAYMIEQDSLHLLQRRPAAAAFREMNDSGQTIPGVEAYTKREIGLRKK